MAVTFILCAYKNETFNTVIPFVVFWLKWVNPFSPRCFPKFANTHVPAIMENFLLSGGKVTFISLFYMQILFAHSVHWTLRGSGLFSSLKINGKKENVNEIEFNDHDELMRIEIDQIVYTSFELLLSNGMPIRFSRFS